MSENVHSGVCASECVYVCVPADELSKLFVINLFLKILGFIIGEVFMRKA